MTGITRTEDKLCKVCRDLDLSAEKFIVNDRSQSLRETQLAQEPYSKKRTRTGRFEVGSGSGQCELGTLRTIWQKSVYCSFCRLVIRSLGELPNTGWIDTDAWPEKDGDHNHDMNAKCCASWQIDGRELDRTLTGSVISSRARTRRIRLHWADDHFEGAYLVLVSQATLPSSNLFLGRRVESAKSNPALIKSWIESCKDHHGDRCKIMHDSKFYSMIAQAYFGVVDVQEMRLTKLPKGARYVALSYTWGKNMAFTTTRKNVRELQANRGLEKYFNKLRPLPPAIHDAMDLVRELGERYFWVDSLCIVQDSETSWGLNAKVMDIVYGNAYLTICAADDAKPTKESKLPEGPKAGAIGEPANGIQQGNGDNPGDEKEHKLGLVAMKPKERHFSQHVEEYSPGVLLMVSHLAESYIQKSAWNTRAWTYQERLLSKRCVIFTHGRVFFQCRSAAMREDIIGEEKVGWSIEHAHAPLQMLDNLDTRALDIYMKSVEEYTLRELTKPEDILSAFAGIGNLLGGTLGAGLVYGLPRSHFDWALLWEPRGASEDRDRSVFPSWSWCGWVGGAMEYKQSTINGTMINLHDWHMNHTWITWYIRDGHGNLKLVWNASEDPKNDQSVIHNWDGYRRDPANADGSRDTYGRSIKLRWPSEPRNRFIKTLPDIPFTVSIEAEDYVPKELAHQFPDQQFLQFFTWSAYLRLTDHSLIAAPSVGHGLKRFGIADYKGDWCGTIVLPEKWVKEGGPGQEHVFLAISDAKEFAPDEYNSWMYYIPKEKEQSEWDLYYVLLIEVKDEIAYRVGLGKVYKEAFANSCREEPQWKEFILG